MRFWEIIQDKEIDIYIGVATTLLGLILGIIVDILRKSGSPNQATNIGYQTKITITNINNAYLEQRIGKQQDDQEMMAIVALFLFCTGVTYLFFISQILHFLTVSVLFILSMGAGATIHSLMQSYFQGVRWTANFLFLLFFCGATIFIANKAAVPNYAPEYFLHSQKIINERGIKGLGNYFSFLDLRWFIFHLIGILIFFYTQTRMTLSVVYFATMSAYLANSNGQGKLPWLAQKTAKYRNVYKNIITTTLMLVVSYYLIAGNFFMWYEYEFPNQMQRFIHRIMNGRS